jgi:hypothetical protein
MTEAAQPTGPKRSAELKVIEAAIQRGVRNAVLAHARAGNPVAAWRDGHVVWLQPAEVLARLAADLTTDQPS